MTSTGRARIDARPSVRADRLRRVLAAFSMLLVASFALATVAPAPVTAAACTGWRSSTEPPETIRVLRTRGASAGRVQTVDFQSYVEVVFPAELGPQHPREMLRAQAVAIKQYAWYHAMNWRGRSAAGGCYDVIDIRPRTSCIRRRPGGRRPRTSRRSRRPGPGRCIAVAGCLRPAIAQARPSRAAPIRAGA